MSDDGNRRVQKFFLTFELDLYAETPPEAFARGVELVRQVAEGLLKRDIARHVTPDLMPFGGIDGAPHTLTLDGWRCFFSLRR